MDTLAAHYIADGFEQGRVKGELNGWKKKAQLMSNEYSVLHRDWHYRGMAAIAWREIATDLYENYYKKVVKPSKQVSLNQMWHNEFSGANNQYPYDPREAPTVR